MIYISNPDNDAIFWPWNVILRVPHPSNIFKWNTDVSNHFFSRSHSCKHIKNVIEMRMQRTSEDSKRKVGLSSSHLAKKRRIISSDNKTSTWFICLPTTEISLEREGGYILNGVRRQTNLITLEGESHTWKKKCT